MSLNSDTFDDFKRKQRNQKKFLNLTFKKPVGVITDGWT